MGSVWGIMFYMKQGSDKIGNELGRLGESVACKYLERKGYTVVERNYRRNWGEIDIIAKDKEGTLHFIEVKSVEDRKVARVTTNSDDFANNNYRPEENIHPAKLKRLSRTIQSYMAEKFGDREVDWKFDAITVRFRVEQKEAKVEFLEDLVIE